MPAYNRNKTNIKLYLRLAKMLKAIDISWISFAGGEPTLFADNLKELFVFLHAQNIGYGMTTNCSIEPRQMKNMLKFIHSINLSFDDIRPQYSLSKKNDCKRLLEFIGKCKDINPNIIFNVTSVLSRSNITNIVNVLDWLKATGEIKFVFIQPCAKRQYYPSRLQITRLKQTINAIDSEFTNLNYKLLEYFDSTLIYSHHKNCSMFLSQLGIDTRIINKKYDVNFLLSPCFDRFPNAALSSPAVSCEEINYDSRVFRMYLRKFYDFIKKVFLGCAGFYGVCNFHCACGPEGVLNDVFWGSRDLTMLTRDSLLAERIATKLRHNKTIFERIVAEALRSARIDRDSFHDIVVQRNTLLWIDLRKKNIVMKTKISKKLNDCISHIQMDKKKYSFAEFKRCFDLSENEEDFIKFLLFQKAINKQ
jgi:pyruvate-formate lyase-activating enzyme